MTLQAALKDNTSNGFTLVELLIVIGITLILAAAVAPIYGNLQVSSQLNENSSQIIQSLRLARERSVARTNNSQHGVYFEIDALGDKDKYVLYQGSTYDTRDSNYDREVILDEVLSLSLPGEVSEYEINFSKGLGVPSATGIITLTHDISGTRQIIINSFGMVEEG